MRRKYFLRCGPQSKTLGHLKSTKPVNLMKIKLPREVMENSSKVLLRSNCFANHILEDPPRINFANKDLVPMKIGSMAGPIRFPSTFTSLQYPIRPPFQPPRYFQVYSRFHRMAGWTQTKPPAISRQFNTPHKFGQQRYNQFPPPNQRLWNQSLPQNQQRWYGTLLLLFFLLQGQKVKTENSQTTRILGQRTKGMGEMAPSTSRTLKYQKNDKLAAQLETMETPTAENDVPEMKESQ